MLLRIVLALSLCVCLSAQSQDVLTNETIAKLHQSGVSASIIIQTIQAASRVDFRFLPVDLAYFASVNLPEDVFKAMAAKSAGRPIPGTIQPPVQPAPPPAPEPRTTRRRERTVRPPRPVVDTQDYDDDGELALGQVEVRVFGGGNGGPDRALFNSVSYSFGTDATVGLMRHLAITGVYAFDNVGKGDALSCPVIGGRVVCSNVRVSQKAHEFMGGLKVPFPIGNVFTPYVQGSLGVVRGAASASASAAGVNVGLSVSETKFAFAPGGGFDFHFSRHIGIGIDLRAVKIIDVTWQYRATGGLIIRF